MDFLYSGELPLDGGNIDHVLEAAHLLQVSSGFELLELFFDTLNNEYSTAF